MLTKKLEKSTGLWKKSNRAWNSFSFTIPSNALFFQRFGLCGDIAAKKET
jgi:hypothetical protein